MKAGKMIIWRRRIFVKAVRRLYHPCLIAVVSQTAMNFHDAISIQTSQHASQSVGDAVGVNNARETKIEGSQLCWPLCLPAKESVESEVDRNILLNAVEKFLSMQPRDKQIMFVRRDFYCSTYAEIARDRNTSEDRVRKTPVRMREKLREHFEKEGIAI